MYKKKQLTFSIALIFLAVWTGLEPATPCVTGRYSNQLNYHTSFGVHYFQMRCKDTSFLDNRKFFRRKNTY